MVVTDFAKTYDFYTSRFNLIASDVRYTISPFPAFFLVLGSGLLTRPSSYILLPARI
jgi:hypothetical protein